MKLRHHCENASEMYEWAPRDYTSATRAKTCTEFTTSGTHFGVTKMVRKNYLGGPALRCGGESLRARLGEMGREEAEVAELTVKATVPSSEGLEFK